MTYKKFKKTGGRDYSDWFGGGNTLEDCEEVAAKFGIPSAVYESGDMILLVYQHHFVVTGYDGSEYCHTFYFHA